VCFCFDVKGVSIGKVCARKLIFTERCFLGQLSLNHPRQHIPFAPFALLLTISFEFYLFSLTSFVFLSEIFVNFLALGL